MTEADKLVVSYDLIQAMVHLERICLERKEVFDLQEGQRFRGKRGFLTREEALSAIDNDIAFTQSRIQELEDRLAKES